MAESRPTCGSSGSRSPGAVTWCSWLNGTGWSRTTSDLGHVRRPEDHVDHAQQTRRRRRPRRRCSTRETRVHARRKNLHRGTPLPKSRRAGTPWPAHHDRHPPADSDSIDFQRKQVSISNESCVICSHIGLTVPRQNLATSTAPCKESPTQIVVFPQPSQVEGGSTSLEAMGTAARTWADAWSWRVRCLAELGWMAMGIVDTMIVGPLGAEAIGAVEHRQHLLLDGRRLRHGDAARPRHPDLASVRGRPARRLPRARLPRGSTSALALTRP